ncbi:hypothetical protein RAZWK3B_10922 [Roseobacter sp. AzwK-3b]|uniref:PepSY domain-containing protein n=1 Tax=Roseobacter sp. AzwK-3b TaxID=351016 RepID=UPI000156A08D|nr:PepSY domain-containing protein [Roseobacter sp. AzwK-3b]EDM69870.1 hypothetical protein RAZWK3B_10922 [Roseobacter sp. AzwK-3b]
MKKTLIALTLFATLPAGAVLADDDDCFVPRDQWQPQETAMQLARQNGWTVREFKIDDACYKIEGRDANGRPIEVKLDPGTLQVVEFEYEDYDDRRGSLNLAPGNSVAPSVSPQRNGPLEPDDSSLRQDN